MNGNSYTGSNYSSLVFNNGPPENNNNGDENSNINNNSSSNTNSNTNKYNINNNSSISSGNQFYSSNSPSSAGSSVRAHSIDFGNSFKVKDAQEPEPASLDSLELPEITMNTNASSQATNKRSSGDSVSINSSKAQKRPRFRPCDACRTRKTKCFIPENSRSCLECSKRSQPCKYDNDKIFLFNNINSLSGVTKFIHDNAAVNKFSSSSKSNRTKPCDGCKKKRSKCIKLENSKSCVECDKKNLICTYSQNLLGMFPATGKVNLLFRNSENSTKLTASTSGAQGTTETDSNVATDNLSDKTNFHGFGSGNENIANVLSKYEKAVEKPVSDYSLLKEPTVMDKSLSLLSSKATTILGESFVIEKRLLNIPTGSTTVQNPILEQDESNQKFIRKLNRDSYFQVMNDDEDFVNLKFLQCDEVQDLVGENSNYLIYLYFKLVHQTLPIVSKGVFYERFFRNYREIHPILLVAVYLLALNWWELDFNEERSDMKFYRSKEKPNVEKLEKIAISLMQDNLYETPKISIVQGLLLLMNYSFTTINPYANSCWRISSIIVTFAQEIGLNWPCNYWENIPLWERKLRKVISWCIVFHDKVYSLLEGKSSMINLDENWIIEDLTINDFSLDPEALKTLQQNELMKKNPMFRFMVEMEAMNDREVDEDDYTKIDDELVISKVIFIETMHMSKHFDRILRDIYSIRSIKFDDFDTLCIKTDEIITQLSSWFQNIPDNIKLVKDFYVKSKTLLDKDDSGFSIETEKKTSGSGLETEEETQANDITRRFALISNGCLNLNYYVLNLLTYKRLITRYHDDLENSFEDSYNGTVDDVLELMNNFKPIRGKISQYVSSVIYKFLFSLKPYNLEPFWLLHTRTCFIFIGISIALLVKTIQMEETVIIENFANTATDVDDNINSLQMEKDQLVNLYKDFYWKLTTMAPDFNHARNALRFFNNTIGFKEEETRNPNNPKFVL